MIRRWKVTLCICIVFFAISGLKAEELKKLAQTSMKWLSIPVGAHPMSLGSAYFTGQGNAENIFWNPAGTGYINSSQLYFSHLPWIADIRQDAVAASLPIQHIGVITASLRYVNYGEIQGTQLASNSDGWEYTEEFSPYSYQIGLGFSQRVTNRFSYGLNVSYAKESLGTVTYAPVLSGSIDNPISEKTSMGLINLDFGVIYYTGFRDLHIGMTLKNFSQEKGYENVDNSIPMDLRIGLGMNILSFLMPEESSQQLSFFCDLSHSRDYTERLHFGLEYNYGELVALRLGYKSNYDEENVAFGAGILPKFKLGPIRLGLDYAYVPFGVFGSLQTFSFSLFY